MADPTRDERRAVLFENGAGDDLWAAVARLVDPATGRYAFPPDDEFFQRHEKLKAEGHLGANQVVAIVDTGIDETHPLLRGAVVARANFTTEETTEDRHGHGTLVALVVRYVAPRAQLINAKVFDRTGSASATDFARALDWVATQKPGIVNLSAGIPAPDPARHWPGFVRRFLARRPRDHWLVSRLRGHRPGFHCAVCAAAERLTDLNACVVTAVGNDPDLITCPGRSAIRGVMAVGSVVTRTHVTFDVAAYSALWPDITAPEIPMAEGTSFSAPFVAGTYAVLLESIYLRHNEGKLGLDSFRRADAAFAAAKWDEAAAIYRETLERLPHLQEHREGKIATGACESCQHWFYTPHLKWGLAELHQGNAAGAVEPFRFNAAIAPQFPDAFLNLGRALLLSKRPADALAAYQEAERLAPPRFDVQDGLGAASWAVGDLAAAAKAYNLSHCLNPRRREPLLQLAKIQEVRGEPDTATILRQRATQCPE